MAPTQAVSLQARMLSTALLALMWETLTDYDKFHRFVTGMHVISVRVLSGNLKKAVGRRHFDDADLIEKRFRFRIVGVFNP